MSSSADTKKLAKSLSTIPAVQTFIRAVSDIHLKATKELKTETKAHQQVAKQERDQHVKDSKALTKLIKNLEKGIPEPNNDADIFTQLEQARELEALNAMKRVELELERYLPDPRGNIYRLRTEMDDNSYFGCGDIGLDTVNASYQLQLGGETEGSLLIDDLFVRVSMYDVKVTGKTGGMKLLGAIVKPKLMSLRIINKAQVVIPLMHDVKRNCYGIDTRSMKLSLQVQKQNKQTSKFGKDSTMSRVIHHAVKESLKENISTWLPVELRALVLEPGTVLNVKGRLQCQGEVSGEEWVCDLGMEDCEIAQRARRKLFDCDAVPDHIALQRMKTIHAVIQVGKFEKTTEDFKSGVSIHTLHKYFVKYRKNNESNAASSSSSSSAASCWEGLMFYWTELLESQFRDDLSDRPTARRTRLNSALSDTTTSPFPSSFQTPPNLNTSNVSVTPPHWFERLFVRVESMGLRCLVIQNFVDSIDIRIHLFKAIDCASAIHRRLLEQEFVLNKDKKDRERRIEAVNGLYHSCNVAARNALQHFAHLTGKLKCSAQNKAPQQDNFAPVASTSQSRAPTPQRRRSRVEQPQQQPPSNVVVNGNGLPSSSSSSSSSSALRKPPPPPPRKPDQQQPQQQQQQQQQQEEEEEAFSLTYFIESEDRVPPLSSSSSSSSKPTTTTTTTTESKEPPTNTNDDEEEVGDAVALEGIVLDRLFYDDEDMQVRFALSQCKAEGVGIGSYLYRRARQATEGQLLASQDLEGGKTKLSTLMESSAERLKQTDANEIEESEELSSGKRWYDIVSGIVKREFSLRSSVNHHNRGEYVLDFKGFEYSASLGSVYVGLFPHDDGFDSSEDEEDEEKDPHAAFLKHRNHSERRNGGVQGTSVIGLRYMRVSGSLSQLGFRVLDRLEQAQEEAKQQKRIADGAVSSSFSSSSRNNNNNNNNNDGEKQGEEVDGIVVIDTSSSSSLDGIDVREVDLNLNNSNNKEEEQKKEKRKSDSLFLNTTSLLRKQELLHFWNNEDSMNHFLLGPQGQEFISMLRGFMESELFHAETRFGVGCDVYFGVTEGKLKYHNNNNNTNNNNGVCYLHISGNPISQEQQEQQTKRQKRDEELLFRQKQHYEMTGQPLPSSLLHKNDNNKAKFKISMRVRLRKIIDSVLAPTVAPVVVKVAK